MGLTEAGSRVRTALVGAGPVVLDTSVLISYLDGGDAFSGAATVLIDELVAMGTNPAVISAVSVTECLVRPFNAGPAAVAAVSTFLGHFPNLRIRPIDIDIATEAARVRAMTGLRAPDALILATALVEGIETVVTADGGWATAAATIGGLRVVRLGRA